VPSLLTMAKTATEGGLAFACAMCKHYWRNDDYDFAERAKGAGACKQTACGGPMSGRTFPSYEGPLPDGDWEHLCFVCASPSVSHGVKIADGTGTRTLAVCDEHVRFVDERAPASRFVVEKPVLLIPKAALGVSRKANRGD